MQGELYRKRIGFFAGLLVFIFILLIPAGASIGVSAKRAAACAALMAIWWITEAIPIPATSLLPMVLYPLLRIMSAKDAMLPYADRNILLFMGGFFIAMAMQRHNLHKRIALHVIRLMGTSSRRLVLGFMIATAFLSMWISNTATAMMMFPIGMAVISHVQTQNEKENPDVNKDQHHSRFAALLMLAIAYAASIGGIGTLVGTPPNIVFAGIVRNTLPGYPEIDFITWLKIGLPMVIIFLPLTWIYLVYIGSPPKMNRIPGGDVLIKNEIMALGKMSRGESITLIVFCLTALGWIFRTNISIGHFTLPGWTNMLGIEEYVHDSTVAMIGSMLLFIIPTDLRKHEFVLDWDWAKRIPWGILILFGGGFALASSFQSTGLDKWIGNMFAGISDASVLVLIISVCLLLTFLTEITSNTATITMMLPVLAAMALSMKIHPFILMIPATISVSCAFMLPVATPPNAIVFGSGYIEMHHMARTGFFLNLIGVIIVTALMYLVIFPLLAIKLSL